MTQGSVRYAREAGQGVSPIQPLSSVLPFLKVQLPVRGVVPEEASIPRFLELLLPQRA